MNRWTEQVDLPITWVHAFGPRLCARHGEPAEDLRRVTFRAKMPPWVWISAIVAGAAVGYGCGPLGAAPVALLASRVTRSKWPPMKVPGWPFCPRCFALHRLYVMCMAVMVLGLAAYLIGLVGFFFGALRPTYGTEDDTMLALMGGGTILALIAVVVGRPFSWRKLGGAHVSRDQSSLLVTAHGRFAADVRARMATQRVPVAP